MIPFFLGTLLGAFLGYAMGSYAMLALPPIGLSDAEIERRTRPNVRSLTPDDELELDGVRQRLAVVRLNGA